MADTTDDQVRALVKAVEDGQLSFDKLSKGMNKLGLTLSVTEKEFGDTVDSMSKLQEKIKNLDNQFAASGNQAERDNIIQQKITVEKQKKAQYDAAKDEAYRRTRNEMMATASKGVVSAFSKATGAALSGGDALSVSAGFMESGIDTANNVMQSAAGGASKFGTAMMSTGGKTAAFGAAISIGATAVGMLSGAISELAKQGIGFMLKETNIMLDSFKAMSSVGAIYVGGMKEMVDVSLSAGLTIDQFTKAVANNRTEFTKAGLSVGDGSKRMAAAMKAGGESARNGMFALGMTMEDQADATAKTMALMAGPSGKLVSSNAEISRQTEEYAKNLKIVSDITGEDAKAKQEEIQKENDTLFMKQKLNAMEPAQRIKFNEMLQNMNGVQRQALAEQMKYGSVISTNLAAAQATSPGIMQANRDFYQAVLDGSMSGEKARDIQMKNADQIKKDAASQTSLSIATGQTAEGMSKVIGIYWDSAAEFSEHATKASQDAAKTAQEHGKLVTAAAGGTTAVDLMAANQNFAIGMQQIAANNLPAFSKALTQTINDIQGAVKAIGGGSASTGSHALGMAGGAIVGGILGSVIPGFTGVGAMIGSSIGGAMFADGGIASGPTSGHAATLHGTELIVPMKGNTLDTSSTGYAELIKALSATAAPAAPAASVSTSSSTTHLDEAKKTSSSTTHLDEAKKTNEQLDELSSSSDELAKLLRRLVELNERILNINEKTLHAVA